MRQKLNGVGFAIQLTQEFTPDKGEGLAATLIWDMPTVEVVKHDGGFMCEGRAFNRAEITKRVMEVLAATLLHEIEIGIYRLEHDAPPPDGSK